ncbi:MAG TPA: DHA2 family efflux MFS transporter permease subunit [Ktedonobacterales bacterium]|nr:DHA2 family efflux MFS transporter permease subunit [Ktedonobacterales bacterium]
MRLTYRWQATLVIMVGLLMAVLDSTIVSVVLPQIATAFHVDYQTITWAGTGYLLAQAAIIPIVGYLSDRAGSKTIFLIALGLFTLGSALCVFAPTAPWLIAFRVLQGLGGGALLPVAMAVLFRLFAPTERAGAIALLLIPLLLGPAFGPTLGGYLATSFSWNAIFTINLPIGVVAFTLAFLVLRGKRSEHEANGDTPAAQGLDLFGLVLSMAGFSALVYGITEAGTRGWGDALVLAFLAGGGALLCAFVVVELRVKDPVMDVRLFRSYTFTMANLLQWATVAVLFGSLFLVPFFFERVEGLSALSTGEILIGQGLATAVGIAIAGKLYNRVGPRILAVTGTALVALSMLGFTRLEVTTSGADVQLWLILRGLGLGLVGQPLQTLAVAVVSNQQMAKASSLINSTKTVFGAVGVAALTTYLTQQATTHAQDMTAGLLTRPPGGAAAACLQQVGQQAGLLQACIEQHALTAGLNDTFLLSLVGCVVCTGLALFLGRDPALEAARQARKRGETLEGASVSVPTD